LENKRDRVGFGPSALYSIWACFSKKQSPATYFSFLEEGNMDDNDIDGMDFVLFIPALKLKIVI
jgi:hypothetical protein